MLRRTLVACIASLSLVFGSVSVVSAATTRKWYAPILTLPRNDVKIFACVIWHESRSTFAHPNLGDDNGAPNGDSGIFQIADKTWNAHAFALTHVVVWRASPFQQALGAVAIFRADGFSPWRADSMCFT